MTHMTNTPTPSLVNIPAQRRERRRSQPQPPVPGDWSSWYLTDEDDMGQSFDQMDSVVLLLSSLEHLIEQRQWANVVAGTDIFFAWIETKHLVRISPDVFLMPWPQGQPRPASIQTWRPGHCPPSVAIEIVSEDWRKDYEQLPPKYEQLDVEELFIYDPEGARRASLPGSKPPQGARRYAIQRFARDEEGAWFGTHAGDGACWSSVLGVYLVIVDTEHGPRPRLSFDPRGRELVPTVAEHECLLKEAAAQRAEAEHQRAEHERQLKEAERQRAEAERQRAEAERQRAEAAERRSATLEAELAALRAALRARDPHPDDNLAE